jgi:hypothetical protein
MPALLLSLLGSFMAPKVLASLGGVLTLILADFVLGVLVAMKSKTFDVRKLPEFMESSFVPYAGGLLILALFSSTDPTLEVLFFAISAVVYAKFLADIKDKIAQLFAGISIQVQSPIEVDHTDTKPVIVQAITAVTNASTDTPAASKTLPVEDSIATPVPTDTATPSVITIQQAVAQGIKDKLTPVAQQQGEQTVQEIINTTIDATVNKVYPIVTA